MSKIMFAGDWHGALNWGKAVIRRAEELGVKTIYHVGDFGWMGRGGFYYTEELAWECEDRGVTIHVTPGNHEDWASLEELFRETPGEPVNISPNSTIFMLPRGYRWEHEGVSFMSLGGAPSIDRNYRTPYLDWWPQEAITLGDAVRAKEGGYVDVMITHDAPAGGTAKVQAILDKPDGDSFWGQDVLEYCQQGHDLLTSVYEAVQPRLLIHGHYHVGDHFNAADGSRDVISLDRETQRYNTVVMDLDDIRRGIIQPKPSGAYIR